MFPNLNFASHIFKPYSSDQAKLYRRNLALKIKEVL